MSADKTVLSGVTELGSEKPLPERVASLESWAAGHDRRCEERQDEIKDLLKEQKSSLQWVGRSVVGLIVALLGWALAELYKAQTPHQAPPAAAPPTIIYAPPGQPPVVVNPAPGQSQVLTEPSPAPAP